MYYIWFQILIYNWFSAKLLLWISVLTQNFHISASFKCTEYGNLKWQLDDSIIRHAVMHCCTVWNLCLRCPSSLVASSWDLKVLTKYRWTQHLVTFCDVTVSHIQADLVGNRFLKVPLFYSYSKSKSGQSQVCVERACVIMPAASTLPGHVGRHQGHKHKQT